MSYKKNEIIMLKKLRTKIIKETTNDQPYLVPKGMNN